MVSGRGANDFESVTFKLIFWIGILNNYDENTLMRMPQNPIVNIGLANGLVPPGNNPLPKPMLNHVYVDNRPQLFDHISLLKTHLYLY